MLKALPSSIWAQAGATVMLAMAALVAIGLALAGPTLLLATAAGLAVVVCFFRFPGILFGAYLLIPFYKGAAQQYSPIDLTVALAALNVAQVVPLLVGGFRPTRSSKVGMALWIGLSALLVAGIFYAPNQDSAVARVVNWALLVAVPISIGGLRVSSDPRHVREMLWTCYGLGAITAIVGLLELSSERRLSVLGANTINVATAALLAPLLTPSLIFWARSRVVLGLGLAVVPAAFVVAIASGSRGPLLVIVLMAAAGLLWSVRTGRLDRQSGRRVAALAILAVVVASATATQLPGESLERFANLGQFVETGLGETSPDTAADASSAARVALFGLATEIFSANPVVGVGPAGYAELSVPALGPWAAPYPHNAILQVAAEYGVIGLMLFVGLFALALFRPLRDGTITPTRLLLVFVLLNAMTSGDVFDNRTLWGLLIVLLLFDASRPMTATGGVATARI